ncbi:MAG: DNA-methyltransferase [Geminicoccaceae bacterium]
MIGDAVLYLGDCLEVMPGLDPVDFIFTDPPYGHNNNNGDLIHNREAALGKGSIREARPIAFDGVEANDMVRAAFGQFNRLLRSGGCCCCCCGGGGGPDPQFARWALWLDEAVGFKQMVVWDKGPMGMGWHYRRSYETVLVGEKKGAACMWYDTSGRIENIIRPGAYGISKIIPQAEDHPTPKPVELAAHFIRLHSQPGQVVLDPFMGGGSTAEAAIKLGRKFVGVEIDPEHLEATIARLHGLHTQRDFFIEWAKPEQEAMDL